MSQVAIYTIYQIPLVPSLNMGLFDIINQQHEFK